MIDYNKIITENSKLESNRLILRRDWIKKLTLKIENELNLFWKWAGIDEKKYSEQVWLNEHEEWEYPNWNELMNLFFEVINILASGEKSELLTNYLLTAMALDNESETIMDECEAKLSYNDLEYLFNIAVIHIQPEARWQIAELIGRKHNIYFEKYLLRFINDCNKYVQRRALLSLSKLHPKKAQEIALQKLHDEDKYLRLVSNRILKKYNS